MKQLLHEKKYPFLTIKKVLKADYRISKLEVKASDMKTVPNSVHVKHFDSKQKVDGSAYKTFHKTGITALKPGIYISERDLKKSVQTKLELRFPKLDMLQNEFKKKISFFHKIQSNAKVQGKKKRLKKLWIASSLTTCLTIGSSFVLAKENESFMQKKIKIEPDKTVEQEPTPNNVIALDGPISIGDVITLQDGATYYKEASMESGETFVYNDYVKEDDYNQITAVAIVDENGEISYVSYQKDYELYHMNEIAIELGLTNYTLMVHLGPINHKVMEGANPYRLGWTSLFNMKDAKSKVYSKK